MKLSIITVNLNNVDGLKKTIDSVISQTFRDFEWIVIDGGSTDGSKELIEQYAEHFAYWVSEKDSGIYNAMNKGVRHANGEYLQFLNSGDCLADDKVLDDVFSTERNNSILYGDIFVVNNNQIIEKKEFGDKLSLHDYFGSAFNHQSTFIPRNLLLENPYDESYKICSDWDFFLKQMMMNYQFCHLNRVICLYDHEGISSCEENYEQINKERFASICKHVPHCVLYDYNNGKIGEIITLRQRHPLFRKLLTAGILILNKMDSIADKLKQCK